jgi:hypothetical protein
LILFQPSTREQAMADLRLLRWREVGVRGCLLRSHLAQSGQADRAHVCQLSEGRRTLMCGLYFRF